MNSHDLILMHVNMKYSSLVHEYDPLQAHEYYLRTRKLKGRGSGITPGNVRTLSTQSKKSQEVKTPQVRPKSKPLPHRPSPKPKAAKSRPDTKARIVALKARAEKLRKLLKELVREAKIRSGIDPDKEAKAKKEDSKKRTAADDKEAAKRSKDYYEKNKEKLKKESLGDEEKKLQESIKEIEKKISKARQDIKDAIEDAKSKVVKRNP